MTAVNLKTFLAVSSSAAVLLTAVGALAQEAAPNIAAASERFDIAQAAPGEVGVGEVVVTARRRLETAQTIPLAVSVIGGDQITSTGANTVGKLQQLAPSVQFFTSNPRNSAVTIRGFGAPFGRTDEQWAGLMTTAFRSLKTLRVK